MSDKLGMIHYGDDSTNNFFGRDMGGSRGYSEKTAEAIDAEVLSLVNTAYNKAKAMITTHREVMEKITAALLEYETLDGKHIRDIIEHGRMLTPPPAPLLPPPTRRPRSPSRQSPSRPAKTTAACSPACPPRRCKSQQFRCKPALEIWQVSFDNRHRSIPRSAWFLVSTYESGGLIGRR